MVCTGTNALEKLLSLKRWGWMGPMKDIKLAWKFDIKYVVCVE